jgi:hypothetical protein
MQWLVSLFVLLLAACASARSAFGNKLLVVLDDVAEKDAYSTFLEDVKGELVPLRTSTGLSFAPGRSLAN